MKLEDILGLLTLVVFVGGIIGLIIWSHKRNKKQEAEFEAWVVSSGYEFITKDYKYTAEAEPWVVTLPEAGKTDQKLRKPKHQYAPAPSNLGVSAFKDGAINRGFTGGLKEAGNNFFLIQQTETRGSGKSRRDYKRTIVGINIPDTQLQLVINSKINNDGQSGGNISYFNKAQRFSLEGDFGVFFDVYMPQTTQSESLSMLTPDSMLYIMTEFADFDIEINGSNLFLYTYRHLNIAEMSSLVTKLDKLLEETRLRKGDVRQEAMTNALVARTATGSSTLHRPLKKDFQILTILFIAVYIAARVIDTPILQGIFMLLFLGQLLKLAYDSAKEARLRKKYHQVIASYKHR